LGTVAGLPTCLSLGLRSKDFAVSHSPDSAKVTATAIAWNLSLHDLILNLTRRFIRFTHIFIKYRAKLKKTLRKPKLSAAALFSRGLFHDSALH
jgi:hypothetical protein